MHLKEKSELNAFVADELIKKGLYAPSIHCLYYSCFQMSIHKLNKDGIDYEQQKRDAHKKTGEGKVLGTHIYTIRTTEATVSDKNTYRSAMGQLRRLRQKSDYNNEPITQTEANAAYGYMQDVLSILIS